MDHAAVLEALPHGIVVLDAHGRAAQWNRAALDILERTPLTLAGATPPFAGPVPVLTESGTPVPELRPATLAALARERTTMVVRRGERVVEMTYTTVRDAVACTLVDVTARAGRELAAARERDRAAQQLDAAAALIVTLDADGRVEHANAAVRRLLAAEGHELRGADFVELAIPVRTRPEARRALARLAAAPTPEGQHFEAPLRTLAGEERGVWWRATPGPDGGAVLTGQDVSERRGIEERLRFLANHDPLTGLPSRGLLDEHLGLAVARARRLQSGVAVVWVDLRLDARGIAEAERDTLVVQAAQRLRSATRAGDLLARPARDEFILVLTDLDDAAGAADQVAARVVRDAFERPLADEDGADVRIAPCAGISLLPDHADNADDLVAGAALALATARASGGGTVVADAAPADPRRPLSTAARLRRALDRDELRLHFQPVRAPHDLRLAGAEALVRWEDPERGLVGPAEFLADAQETGLAGEIDAWVLDALCRHAREWGDAGLVPRLSFNVSATEVARSDLAADVVERVAAHGLDPQAFCVELPEAAAVAHPQRAAAFASDLRDAGFAVAIDDVGGALASLARLQDLRANALKLDRALLRGVPTDRRAGSILAAVLALARTLGMAAVAKGVETDSQREFLVTHGAPLAQGFLLGRPLPAEEMADLVRSA
ncbi:MAG TPA: EAL domain-containing protein [Solirubrobacteraceae bacterium]|nr:EAL domain-containing protein [Solirubrobacteraceae bacterium]